MRRCPTGQTIKEVLKPMNIITLVLAVFGLYHIRHDILGHKTVTKVFTYFASIIRICNDVVAVCLYTAGPLTANDSLGYQLTRIFVAVAAWKNLTVTCLFFYIFEKKKRKGFYELIRTWETEKRTTSNDRYHYISICCILIFTSAAISSGLVKIINVNFFEDHITLNAVLSLHFGYLNLTKDATEFLSTYYLYSSFIMYSSDGISLMLLCFVCVILHRELRLFNANLKNKLKPWMIKENDHSVISSTEETTNTNHLDNTKTSIKKHHKYLKNTARNHDSEVMDEIQISNGDQLDQVGLTFLKLSNRLEKPDLVLFAAQCICYTFNTKSRSLFKH